jgi:exosortase
VETIQRGLGSRLLPWAAWLLAIALSAPVLRWLANVWATSVYDAHGVLVPLVAAAMVFSQRRALSALPHGPDNTGLWLTGAGIVLLLAALLMNFNLLGGVALVVIMAGMVWSLWGPAVLRLIWFPLAFLLLMLPLNYPLEILLGFPMRLLSTKLSGALLGLFGQTVEVHGTVIGTPQFSIAIESPCSGLKTLSALLTVGLVLGYFLHQRLWRRVLIILLVPPVAILANAIRNIVILLIGHYYGTEAAEGWLHTFSGIVVFLLAAVMLILVSEAFLWRRTSD